MQTWEGFLIRSIHTHVPVHAYGIERVIWVILHQSRRSNSLVTPTFSQDMPAKVASEQSFLEDNNILPKVHTHLSLFHPIPSGFFSYQILLTILDYIELCCPSLILNGKKRTKRTQHLPQPAQKPTLQHPIVSEAPGYTAHDPCMRDVPANRGSSQFIQNGLDFWGRLLDDGDVGFLFHAV